MRILVVAAHPDDEILGPGGTILRHVAAGDDVTVYIACAGTNIRYEAPQAADLYNTARRVGGLLGAVVRLGELPDQGLDTLPLTRVISALDAEIVAADPDLMYVHYWGDINRDHRILAEALLTAGRPYAAPHVRTIRCFETPSSTEWGSAAGLAPFVPNLFVDVVETLNAKLDAFASYVSEVRPWPHPRSREALEARARTWGSVSGLAAAEAFVVARDRW
jgi:LmbE family N-acetylglucosaminyl deacetylase